MLRGPAQREPAARRELLAELARERHGAGVVDEHRLPPLGQLLVEERAQLGAEAIFGVGEGEVHGRPPPPGHGAGPKPALRRWLRSPATIGSMLAAFSITPLGAVSPRAASSLTPSASSANSGSANETNRDVHQRRRRLGRGDGAHQSVRHEDRRGRARCRASSSRSTTAPVSPMRFTRRCGPSMSNSASAQTDERRGRRRGARSASKRAPGAATYDYAAAHSPDPRPGCSCCSAVRPRRIRSSASTKRHRDRAVPEHRSVRVALGCPARDRLTERRALAVPRHALWSSLLRFEQLDEVAGGVLHEVILASTYALDEITAK